ncbi:MAG: glycoside hydrolase family 3 C-terminal domain-containing protein [Bacteroidales bacterium]|nr:glycoside hydrolase family 3 C-terminal domain-containing protein [Bacteroidales bacterium]
MFRYVISFILLLSVMLSSCNVDTKNSKIDTPLYLNATYSIDERVDDLLKRMTLEEKVAQMCQYVGIEHMKIAEHDLSAEEMLLSDAQGFYPGLHSSDVEKLVAEGLIGSFLHVTTAEEVVHLQQLAQKSRLKIPLLIGIDAIHGTGLVKGATIYPTPIGLASTFDTSLVYNLSVQTAREMRATGSGWTFTPNIDVSRDARWGRVGETFGEDPFLVSQMGVSMIEGLQNTSNEDSYNVIACAKHLIAGSQSINGLNGAPTDLSERTIREIFLPPYQAAVDAGVFSLMAAHNELNGIPCHSNEWMMTDVLRDEFGFDGFIVSDWMDIERLVDRHFTAKNQKEACFQTIDAGMDMHMHGPGFFEPVLELVNEGSISESRVNESVKLLLEAKFKLGLFENPLLEISENDSVLFNLEHQKTALEAAQKSIVLLKNEKKLLPLDKSKYKRIFVTGPNADNQTILGDWAVEQAEENVITVLEGLQQADPECNFDYFDVGYNPGHVKKEHVIEAKKRASQAELAIVVVGDNSYRWEWNNKTNGENAARSDIGLAGLQNDLVQAVYESGTPTIVILCSGKPLAVEWIADNIPAIIEIWEPGSFGGLATAQILYGEVNPSGKLPITIPRSSGHQLSTYNHKPSNYFHKYVDSKSDPLFPFGYGLSYANFSYNDLQLSSDVMKKGNTITISVDITNKGSVPGDEVVQLYLNDKFCSVTRPVKELKAFKRISLAVGETKKVSFSISRDMLRFLDKNLEWSVEEGEFIAMLGSSSKNSDLLKLSFYYEE